MVDVSALVESKLCKRMKITLVSTSDSGGAGRAALKIHKALLRLDYLSTLRVSFKKTDHWAVESDDSFFKKIYSRVRHRMDSLIARLQYSPDFSTRSFALFPTGLARQLNRLDSDIVQLNWVAGSLSIEEIGQIRKPVVWRLSDMWAFCGAEHYTEDGPDARWLHGYDRKKRPSDYSGLDIDRWVWARKKKAWKEPMYIVAPSKWLATCVENSALMKHWPVTVIPTPIDMNQFQPLPKNFARQALGLPLDRKLLMFGSISGTSDQRKGWQLLVDALRGLPSELFDIVILGQSKPKAELDLDFQIHWLGRLHDDASLACAYSSSDAFVMPSLQDNLPQSGLEAQSCGCPVITFNAGGMMDIVEHLGTGYLAEAFNSQDLANGIRMVLSDSNFQRKLSDKSRERAIQLWSTEVVAEQYIRLYEKILEHRKF